MRGSPFGRGRTQGVCDLRHVSASGLAERRDGVDGGDALRQHGIRGQLAQLGAPQAGAQHALARHPALVYACQRLHRCTPLGRFAPTNQHLLSI